MPPREISTQRFDMSLLRSPQCHLATLRGQCIVANYYNIIVFSTAQSIKSN
ncbi:hypothetical protein D3C76_1706260 [compost metagenome]